MRNFKAFWVVIFTALFAGNQSMAQTTDAIIDKYLEATGGADKWKDMNSYVVKKSFKANAATDYDEELTVEAKEKKLSRKKTILQRDFFYVANGNSGWLKIPMGSRDKAVTYTTKDLSDKERDELLDEIKEGLLPFVNYAEKGFTAISGGEKTVEGKVVNLITLTKGDTKREYYFDKTTGLLNREVLIEGGVTHTTDHTTYSTAKNGIKYPSVSVYINSKDKKKTNVTTEWIFNSEIPAAMFVK